MSEKGQILSRRGHTGGELESVAPGSLGAVLGLAAGRYRAEYRRRGRADVIDYQYYLTAGAVAEIEVERAGERIVYEVELEGDDYRGPAYPSRLRRHPPPHQRLPLCFVKQVPRAGCGARSTSRTTTTATPSSTYFVTLINYEEDWQRIGEQHLSPLNVSVHATDPQLRVDLLRHPRAGAILDDLRRLGEMGIAYNTQLVLNPHHRWRAARPLGARPEGSAGDHLDRGGAGGDHAARRAARHEEDRRDRATLHRALPGLPGDRFHLYTEAQVRDDPPH
ncbi:MAG: hypothetical protein U0841_23855 [Chloroflexia bacterium]